MLKLDAFLGQEYGGSTEGERDARSRPTALGELELVDNARRMLTRQPHGHSPIGGIDRSVSRKLPRDEDSRRPDDLRRKGITDAYVRHRIDRIVLRSSQSRPRFGARTARPPIDVWFARHEFSPLRRAKRRQQPHVRRLRLDQPSTRPARTRRASEGSPQETGRSRSSALRAASSNGLI